MMLKAVALSLIVLLMLGSTGEPSSSTRLLLPDNGSPVIGSNLASPEQGPRDVTELEHFLDSFFEEQMAAQHILGAAFVLVKDGSLFLSKGYGYANLENRQPVDPAHTLFNLASVGKLFTATAVMQLVEEGRLHLDDPVSNYMDDLTIDSNFARPVTVADLLTHTAGFEERVSGAWVGDSDGLQPLDSYLPLLLALPLLTSILTVGTFIMTADAWRHRRWSFVAGLHYTFVALAGLVFIWLADYWNLLGFRL